jgi:hypothetical protein
VVSSGGGIIPDDVRELSALLEERLLTARSDLSSRYKVLIVNRYIKGNQIKHDVHSINFPPINSQ